MPFDAGLFKDALKNDECFRDGSRMHRKYFNMDFNGFAIKIA
jgi:hypothetical protein